MNIDEMKELLIPSISKNRYSHTLGVVETAKVLASLHGADVLKAEKAALLHDCAKGMSEKDMLTVCAEENFPPDEFEKEALPVLHAPAGAALSKKLYGIHDPEILNAIRSHTIGCLNPSKLDAIIFVADFIEPGRRPFEGLEHVRRLSRTNLLSALKECARLSGDYVKSNGGQMHPTTIKMINDTEELT